MNNLPCGKCVNYDPILGSGEKHIKKGWCVKKSKYPAHEGPGQSFPKDAQRVEHGQLAEPYIVREDQVVIPCPDAIVTTRDALKTKKDAQIKTDKTGKRILS